MRSKYPWEITLCSGGALQFLITDANGNIVLMGEMYHEADLLALLALFQRNPEIRVKNSETFAKTIKDRRYENARTYIDGLLPKDAMKLLKKHNYDVVRAAEADRRMRDNIPEESSGDEEES